MQRSGNGRGTPGGASPFERPAGARSGEGKGAVEATASATAVGRAGSALRVLVWALHMSLPLIGLWLLLAQPPSLVSTITALTLLAQSLMMVAPGGDA